MLKIKENVRTVYEIDVSQMTLKEAKQLFECLQLLNKHNVKHTELLKSLSSKATHVRIN